MSYNLKKLLILAAMLMPMASFVAPAYAEEAKSDAKSDSKKSTTDDSIKNHFVKVPPLILPVMGDNGVEQIVSIVVVIEATSKEAADQMTEVIPRLNDAYLTELYGSIDRRERMKYGVIDVGFVKQKLTEITIKIVGQDKFKALLIQGVGQHQS